jgi:hypothetical protein
MEEDMSDLRPVREFPPQIADIWATAGQWLRAGSSLVNPEEENFDRVEFMEILELSIQVSTPMHNC